MAWLLNNLLLPLLLLSSDGFGVFVDNVQAAAGDILLKERTKTGLVGIEKKENKNAQNAEIFRLDFVE